MAIVDVDAVAVEDEPELIDEALSRGLDSQDVLDLIAIVGLRALVIDFVNGENSAQAHSICLDDPVVVGLHELASLLVVLALDVLGEGDLRYLKKAFDDQSKKVNSPQYINCRLL